MISLALLLSVALDGEAALRHARALSALGPHPFGSPRGVAAAQYVAAQFREVGLGEVRLETVEAGGLRGTNVVGVLRASGTEFLVVGAHHDTPSESPGAHPSAGVGTLVEAARSLVRRGPRGRTIVFVSFDGEDAASARGSAGIGSRAYLQSLGPDARHLAGLLAITGSGWKGGRPVLRAAAYADPLRPGATVVAPAPLVRAVLEGARDAASPLAVGEPLAPWLYQPAVRFFRATDRGPDIAALQAGRPAVALCDEPFLVRYPWAGQSTDTPDKLDAEALARLGQSLLGAVAAAETLSGMAAEPNWLAALGRVVNGPTLLALGVASLVPGFLGALRGGGLAFAVRLVQALLFGLMLFRLPVPTLWVFLLPNLVTPLARGRLASLVAIMPAFALALYGGLAWSRGFVAGVWAAPWELAILGFAFALLWLRPGGRLGRATIKGRRRGGPRR
jgi:hypothetical protein